MKQKSVEDKFPYLSGAAVFITSMNVEQTAAGARTGLDVVSNFKRGHGGVGVHGFGRNVAGEGYRDDERLFFHLW